jgi:hypothetical protein
MKTIRKYGGLDNYILLNPSYRLRSQYGEYLRKVMLEKLNNPDWELPDMVGEKRFIEERMPRLLRRLKAKYRDSYSQQTMIIPKDLKNKDLGVYGVGKFIEGFTPYKDRDLVNF